MTGAIRLTREQRQTRFLEAFSIYGNIWKACEESGVERRNIYNWQEHDEKFLLAFNVANELATERLEEAARRRASDGTKQEKPIFYLGQQVGSVIETDYSDSLLMFLLKARKPEKYKDRIQVDVNAPVKAYSGVDVDAV